MRITIDNLEIGTAKDVLDLLTDNIKGEEYEKPKSIKHLIGMSRRYASTMPDQHCKHLMTWLCDALEARDDSD